MRLALLPAGRQTCGSGARAVAGAEVRAAARVAAWAVAALALAWPAAAAATSPDSAGLVGSSPERPTLPFKLWARSPKSPLKPRRRDLREADLRQRLGADFDPRWMGTSAHYGNDPPEGPRQSVQKLVTLVAREVLPEGLSAETREVVRAWLVRRATCPVRYVWEDLGPYFWPRWVRGGHCSSEADAAAAAASTPAPGSLPLMLAPTHRPHAHAAARNASGGGGGGGGGGGEAAGPRPCSWPPGMRCVPSAAKVLQLLRWHCRLRKSALSNSVWIQSSDPKKKRRKRFRCQWLKVPYPVAKDCTCA